MTVTISPSSVSGRVKAPPSKSCMQRACAAALINDGTTIIENAGTSNDEQAAKKIVEKLGASVDTVRKEVIITSSKHIFLPPSPVNIQLFPVVKVVYRCGCLLLLRHSLHTKSPLPGKEAF